MNKKTLDILKRYKPTKATFLYVGCAYLIMVTTLYMLQGYLIFAPYTFNNITLEQSYIKDKAQSLRIKDETGLQTSSWIIPPKTNQESIIIFFHGNAVHALYGHKRALFFHDHGFGYVLAEYPGYGGNEGSPSEKSFYATARSLITKIKKTYPAQEIILHGSSIGTGVATQMAMEFDIKALILEAPFSSVTEVAKSKYFYVPVSLLLKHRFDSIDKIDAINAPVLIIHGSEDKIIPLKYGKKLYEAAIQPKALKIIEGAGHNNLLYYNSPQIALDFIKGLDQ
jgi:hypothetical protein